MDIRGKLYLAERIGHARKRGMILQALTGCGTRRLGDFINGTRAAVEYCAAFEGR